MVRQNNVKGCLLLYYLQVTGMPSNFSCNAGRQELAVMFRSSPTSVISHSSCVTLRWEMSLLRCIMLGSIVFELAKSILDCIFLSPLSGHSLHLQTVTSDTITSITWWGSCFVRNKNGLYLTLTESVVQRECGCYCDNCDIN